MAEVDEDIIFTDLENLVEGYEGQLIELDTLETYVKHSKKVLNILQLNIRSARENFDKFLLLFEQGKLSYCDIFILTETFQMSSPESFSLLGYNTYYNQGDYNRNDGILILTKLNLNPDISHHKMEKTKMTVSRLTFKYHDQNYGITALYKSPQVDNVHLFQDLFNFYLHISQENIEIFTGDININIKVNDPVVTEYLSLLGGFGFAPYIKETTRYDSNSCLDHFFIKNKHKHLNFNSFILHTFVTDHYPIMINITNNNTKTNNIKQIEQQIRKQKVNYDILKNNLSLCDWTDVVHLSNPEQATNLFIKILSENIKKATITKHIKQAPSKSKEWITNGLIMSIKHRDKIKKDLQKNFETKLKTL